MASVNGLPEDEPLTILYIGQHETQRGEPATSDILHRAQELGYDILTTPITTLTFHSRVLATLEAHAQEFGAALATDSVQPPIISPLTPTDSDLVPEDSNTSLIALVSPWIDLASSDPWIAQVSLQVFGLEVAYAAFCGINNILVHGPSSSRGTVRFARATREALGLGAYVQLHVLLPMTGELEQDVSADGASLAELARPQFVESADEDESEPELFASWESWDTIRTICSYSNKLSIALEIPRVLPPLASQSRWYSEPVRMLLFPRTTFLRNGKGFPVLSKQHQQYLSLLLRLRFPPWAVLSDVGSISAGENGSAAQSASEPTPAEASATKTQVSQQDPTQYLQYMRHLQQSQPSRPPIERFGQGYQDYMQSPLQPLTDNLESITYEVFEKDPVKYEWYERAVALALKDLRAVIGGQRDIVVAVVGAGRGPLVTRVLQASAASGVGVKCHAVEKNPNAHVLLQRRNATDKLWAGKVTVVKSDMRTWPGPLTPDGQVGKVDILVSELLGSFADNELSPECLDGVQHVLDLDHGVSIPQSYSAHMTPIASPRLYSELLGRTATDLNMSVNEKWELPYVVMLHQLDYLSTHASTPEGSRTPDIKQAWSFSHPAPPSVLAHARHRAGGTADAGGSMGGDGTNEHNARTCTLRFTCAHLGVCHGLAGYFEAVLYSQSATKSHTAPPQIVELSTNPATMEEKCKDMISWFPIFFPLKTPLFVPEGAEMEVSMWRQTDDRKVWYEWAVEVFVEVGGAKRMKVGMSELHSSRRNGCLM
ncbi:hypothetical protein LTR53_003290 [Teratosphaeriaceae sp. CCFEE 6253]|nr:hypothetical protein LTR53_003290 [Teratosphaeriaceae sp. CCFEE 6253]